LICNYSDDYEDNQRTNRSLASEHTTDTLATAPKLCNHNETYIKEASQIENSTVLRDEGGVAPTSRSALVVNQVSWHFLDS